MKPGILRGKWSDKEDQLLRESVAMYGLKWSMVASRLNNRTPSQCRERWIYHLSPELNKTHFTKEEDEQLMALHEIYGNKWSVIAIQMKSNRSEASIRTRFYALFRNRMLYQSRLDTMRDQKLLSPANADDTSSMSGSATNTIYQTPSIDTQMDTPMAFSSSFSMIQPLTQINHAFMMPGRVGLCPQPPVLFERFPHGVCVNESTGNVDYFTALATYNPAMDFPFDSTVINTSYSADNEDT